MQITYGKALAVEELITKFSRQSLPFKTSYKLAKIQQSLHEELALLNSHLTQVIKKWAVKDDKGNLVPNETNDICVSDNNIDKCIYEMHEIVKTNIIIPDVFLTIEELEDCGFTIEEIQVLLPFIERV